MQALAFLGGHVADTDLLRKLIRDFRNTSTEQTQVFAADLGAATALACGLDIDLLLGDFDSLDPAILENLKKSPTEVQRYPIRKNATDGELLIESIISNKATRVLLFCGLGPDRPDHVLMNIEMMLRLKRLGMDVALSDGKSLFRALQGPEHCSLAFSKEFAYRPLVSFLAVGASLEGLSFSGLSYQNKHTIPRGSSIAISNYPAYFDEISTAAFAAAVQPLWHFTCRLDSGEGLLIITPQD